MNTTWTNSNMYIPVWHILIDLPCIIQSFKALLYEEAGIANGNENGKCMEIETRNGSTWKQLEHEALKFTGASDQVV